MSQFVLPSQSGGVFVATLNDERVQPRFHRMAIDTLYRPFEPGVLWTDSQYSTGDPGVDRVSMDLSSYDLEPFETVKGTASWFKIIGITRDSSGNPLGNCIVQGFLTSSDLFLRQIASDPGGYFEFPTEYPSPTQHYLVAYKAGSPDVAGTSANTLTAS